MAQGAPGAFRFVDKNSTALGTQYSIGGAADVDARTGIGYLNDNLLFAAGAEGVLLLDGKSGNVSKAVELNIVEGVDPADVVANSVSVNEGLIYGQRCSRAIFTKSQGQSIELQGIIDLGASANVV